MTFLDILSIVSDILSVVTAGIALYGMFWVFPKKWRQRKIQALNPQPGTRSGVLVIGLGSKAANMESYVRNYLESQPELMEQLGGKLDKGTNLYLLIEKKNLPEPIDKIGGKPGGTVDIKAVDYISEIIDKLNSTMGQMANVGISRLHLFYQGPAILATVIGAALGNRFTVLCYHWAKSTYYSVGAMEGIEGI